MFTKAGPHSVIIQDVKFAEPKFAEGANDFDIAIRVTNVENEAESDWARLEVSQDPGKGNFATMTQAEITLKTLRNLGYEGDDLTTLKTQLVGKKTTAMIKESTGKDGTKIFYNVQYIGGGSANEPEEIDDATMKARVAALFGGAAAPAEATAPAPAPAPAPAAAAPKGNPFGGTPKTTAPASAKKNPFAK